MFAALSLLALAAAVLLAQPAPRGRARRVPFVREGGRAGSRDGARQGAARFLPAAWVRPGPPGPGRRGRESVDVGALVGEVAALLRTGLLPAEAWAQACARRPATARAMARATAQAAQGGAAGGADVGAAGAGRRHARRLPSLLRREADPAVAQATAGTRAALALAADVGAPPAEVLDQCVQALSEAAAAESARATALAGPRSSARLLAALPLLGLALGFGVGADPVAVFTDGSWGSACLLVGVALMVTGHRWVAREVATAVRE